jgi:hypothetical protein
METAIVTLVAESGLTSVLAPSCPLTLVFSSDVSNFNFLIKVVPLRLLTTSKHQHLALHVSEAL